jgi:hypothetical protein
MLHILIGRALNVDAGVAASEAEMRAAILPWKIRGLQRAGACSKPATSSLATKRRRSNAQSEMFRMSCCSFAANAVRLQLHALAYNLANFMRTLALPEAIKHWSLTGLREKLVKIGAKVVRHGRYVIFQMAEVAVPRGLFHEILRLIAELRPQPPPAPA